MTAEVLRRLLTDEELERLQRSDRPARSILAIRAIVDRLTDDLFLFEATGAERDQIAIQAFEAMGTQGGASFDASVARALLFALRETVLPGVAAARARLHGPATEALLREEHGHGLWESVLRPLLGHLAQGERVNGATRSEAALRTLVAAARMKGDALCREGDVPLLQTLGAAASRACLRAQEEISPLTLALKRLATAHAEENVARLSLWDDEDAETVRLLGAGAAHATFGRGATTSPIAVVPKRVKADDGRVVFEDEAEIFHLPEAWQAMFAHLRADASADRLEAMASDPRLSDREQRLAALLSEALHAHPASSHVSFSEALGMEASDMRRDVFRPGQPVYRAALRGRYPTTLICTGGHGRSVRCRAVADAQGALVGYLAFDPFSREMGGRPLFAAYALDGQRYGYAWADQPPVIRAGEPQQGFVTAPVAIPI